MNDRLLKESDVMRAVDERIKELSSDSEFVRKKGYIDVWGVKKYIAAIPSADGPQGEWVPATWQDEHCPERLKRHKCSECGNRAEIIIVKTKLVDNYYCNKAEPITEYTHEEQLSKYCPNCGARMKGVDDE